ncbi:bifunctional acetate--CoA ligase family protein/GNAT family N-acetyltransferase [Teredinibacter turnerae]|uniref:bifunctional acetate--CoA ligase family protein/GNAT family N-acetyltransferase n=1 Tax=Teredinibacter turnerae TaxID=2426 RepID=UPI00035D62BF|nr:bifunctional acetate--CoA ligase family protein/GNAT family N-acetyltransferase [Teredinibacter turnerae]
MSDFIEHYLSDLFAPQSIAVFGASQRPNATGSVVFRNLIAAGFCNQLYAINPKYTSVDNHTCYRSLDDIDDHIELAVITTPAHTVKDILKQCGKHKVKAAVIFAGGFAQPDEPGKVSEQALVEIARKYGIRFIGPNSLGIAHPSTNINATFGPGEVASGNLALVSQSGAVCTAVMDWAAVQDIGFSSVVSIGACADLDFGDILDFLVSDGKTRSILLYVEGIRDARSFMCGLRAVARVKPVIVIKAGRHKAAIEVTQSHNSARVGDDDVFAAALKRAGVVRGMHLGDLLAAANILARGTRLRGDKLAIITNGGGPAAMACDRASDLHIPLAPLGEEAHKKLDKLLPHYWSHSNPVDILGDADADRYAAALEIMLADTECHGVMVMLTPQATTDPVAIAQRLIDIIKKTSKPVIACWMGENRVLPARRLFASAGIPIFRLPETAVQAFAYLATFFRNQKLLLQTPPPLSQTITATIEDAHTVIDTALRSEQFQLSETESKTILAAFGIPIAPTILVHSAQEAMEAATEIGLPVAMKIHGSNLSNKSSHGGVQLNIRTLPAVKNTYAGLRRILENLPFAVENPGIVIEPMILSPAASELRLAIEQDPVFGPFISLGPGGVAAKRTRVVSLPPLNRLLAANLIQESELGDMLSKEGQQPVIALAALENCLMSISDIACELPEVLELEINPLLADSNGVTAVDARIRLRPKPPGLPYSHTAIHPYPSHAVQKVTVAGCVPCTIRPVRPEDAELERAFIEGLSENSKHFRFMNTFRKLPPEMLAKMTQIDYDREMAFVAVINNNEEEEEIGSARYAINIDGQSCEFAVSVADNWQGKGIATKLMQALIDYAGHRGLTRMQGEILADNVPMQELAKKLGFSLQLSREDKTIVIGNRPLRPPAK